MTPAPRADVLLEQYFTALDGVDAAAATDLVMQLLYDGTPLEWITANVLAPAQQQVGRMWEQGHWSVADEHAATEITEHALASLVRAAGPARQTASRHVVVACVEGEWHSLAARMLAAAAAATDPSTRVTVLGPSLPSTHLQRHLAAGDVDLLALTCAIPANLVSATRSINAAHAVGVPVVIGGRALGGSPARAHALGADAWAQDASALRQDPPSIRTQPVVVPADVLALDRLDARLVDRAYDDLLTRAPSYKAMPPDHVDRTREDLVWMARFTAAALLVDDRTVVDDLLTWLVRLLDGKVEAEAIAHGAYAVADAIDDVSPRGASLLAASTDATIG